MALAVVVALTVDPTTQAGLRKDPLINFALTLQLDLCFVNVDFFFELRGELSLQGLFPRKSVQHVRFLSCKRFHPCPSSATGRINDKSPPPQC